MSRVRRLLAHAAGDALYRTSGLLVVNLTVLSGLGFVFWTAAARLFPARDVGVLSGWVAACTLLATVGGLGLGNMLIRQLPSHHEQRRLIMTSAALLATLGAVLSVAAMLAVPIVAPSRLGLDASGGAHWIVLVLVVATALSALVDAALVAAQAARQLVTKNVAGGIVRIALLVPLMDGGVAGLLLAYTGGLLVAFSLGNYLGGVVGILPSTAVPLIVLAVLGPTPAAYFGVAFLMIGFLNFLPSSVAQAYFAHASHPDVDAVREFRKAIGTSYAVMLPACAGLIVAAPLLLRIFGPGYAAGATTPLRILALAGIATALTYLIDAALNVQHRPLAYGVMNAVNAALVVGGVALVAHDGLTAVAVAWLIAQAASALIGVAVVAYRRRSAVALRRSRYAREGI
jgi:O-antigen/teichoic acid export membrane protein